MKILYINLIVSFACHAIMNQEKLEQEKIKHIQFKHVGQSIIDKKENVLKIPAEMMVILKSIVDERLKTMKEIANTAICNHLEDSVNGAELRDMYMKDVRVLLKLRKHCGESWVKQEDYQNLQKIIYQRTHALVQGYNNKG